jgi:hypothetical protein
LRVHWPLGQRNLGAAELAELVVSARSLRGSGVGAGPFSDLLRAVGRGLDSLNSAEVRLNISPTAVEVSCRAASGSAERIQIAYTADDLAALRRNAVLQREGVKPWQVTLLHDRNTDVTPLRAILAAECSVESRSYIYSRAIAVSGAWPSLVMCVVNDAEQAEAGLEALIHLGPGETRPCPILLVEAPDVRGDDREACRVLSDDVGLLTEPPAAIRNRVRGLLLGRNRRVLQPAA